MSEFGSYKKKELKSIKPSKFRRFWRRCAKWQKAVFISCLSLLTVVVITVGVLGGTYLSIMGKIKRDHDFNKLDNKDLGFDYNIDSNIYNIALFGIDTQNVNKFSGNSDSIMILSLNKSEHTIKLISVMRDSLVPIEKNGKTTYNKINSAYAYGGAALAVKTLNTVFGLDIAEYATVNFFGMIDIIDEVGGIEAEITKSELNCKVSINGHIMNMCESLGIDYEPYWVNQPGRQHLNGIQAVAYARVRYGTNWLGSSNDFGRTERQRYVMEQLLDKALNMDVTSYPSLVNKLAPYVQTSFSNSQLINLAMFLKDKPTMITTRIPHDEYIINADFRKTGASSVYYNYSYAAKVLHAFLYDDIEPSVYMEQNGVDKSEWYGVKSGTSKSTSSKTASVTSSKATSSKSSAATSSAASSRLTSSSASGTESSSKTSSAANSTASTQTGSSSGTSSAASGSTVPIPEEPDPDTDFD